MRRMWHTAHGTHIYSIKMYSPFCTSWFDSKCCFLAICLCVYIWVRERSAIVVPMKSNGIAPTSAFMFFFSSSSLSLSLSLLCSIVSTWISGGSNHTWMDPFRWIYYYLFFLLSFSALAAASSSTLFGLTTSDINNMHLYLSPNKSRNARHKFFQPSLWRHFLEYMPSLHQTQIQTLTRANSHATCPLRDQTIKKAPLTEVDNNNGVLRGVEAMCRGKIKRRRGARKHQSAVLLCVIFFSFVSFGCSYLMLLFLCILAFPVEELFAFQIKNSEQCENESTRATTTTTKKLLFTSTDNARLHARRMANLFGVWLCVCAECRQSVSRWRRRRRRYPSIRIQRTT